jgi:cellulose synthase/poly-beta-1,6-N-acetylglucosamine synthase-like glycosyltransferase/peptidoglycan/xylan/chitin deacetylase (PgdA/CDA1 family)/spore germination protein YaaH
MPAIFYDASGTRRWFVGGTTAILLLFGLLALGVLALTIVRDPTPPPIVFQSNAQLSAPGSLAALTHKLRRVLGTQRSTRGAWLPPAARAALRGHPLTIGFYTPDDDGSVASLDRHINTLDWVSAADFNIIGADHHLRQTRDPKLQQIMAHATRKPKLMPLVQNADNGVWDGKGIAVLLHDPAQRAALLDRLTPALAATRAQGAVFDFEEVPAAAHADYLAFLREAVARWRPKGWLVSLAVPVADEAWDLRAFGRAADNVLLMTYDQHWESGTAGPIAAQAWFVERMKAGVAAVGADKAIVCIGNYAYDWADGAKEANELTVEEAWLTAHDNGATIRFDADSGNPMFDYRDDGGTQHHVWMLDAASGYNQARAVRLEGAAGVAIWRLGSEDPGLWASLAAAQTGARPDLAELRTSNNVDLEGKGELLRIAAVPTNGARTIGYDADGLIREQTYLSLPTPFVVQRAGFKPGLVALTFDDGPSPDWTPQILDVLKAAHVRATFFVVGVNGVGEPDLLRRIVDEGHEIGNHSYTHPNMAKIGPEEIRLELNATQRLIEAYTGRTTRLFRAPFFGDAEPTSADELIPALTAQQDGYLNVGLHVDPDDWQRPGADAIVARTIAGVTNPALGENYGNVILLHDGGGERSQTLQALPRIIAALKARGYRFVSVSELAGLSREAVNPPVPASEVLAVRADEGVFTALDATQEVLGVLFIVAIALGITRAVVLSALALRARARTKAGRPPPEAWGGMVSVLIPAFNEARVIEESVRRVLASVGVAIEVIVLDDGSKDATSAIVAHAFGSDARVRLLTLENGGKARALNRGLALAQGEVIVALDADTQFEVDTIAKLARWFADARLGAVAGNAKVGNRVNIVTRWQAVEYVTAQNLERRALAGLDAITVVPGAVGAWRASALKALGGYPIDTLAEDQDLTIAVQRAGWDVRVDVDAVAWTEAPQTMRELVKQRFRWAYGTLQCLYKHRAVIWTGYPRGLARVGLPQAWVFQIGFALFSPLIDLALVISMIMTAIAVRQHGWAAENGDLRKMAIYWLAFTTIDLFAGWIAYALDRRERTYPWLLLLSQRFVYRQLMYWVVVRAVSAALRGPMVGWGKLERTGTVAAA